MPEEVAPSCGRCSAPYEMDESLAVRLAASLGIGLLIGAERERRKGSGSNRNPAGLRTFAVTALVGGVSLALPLP